MLNKLEMLKIFCAAAEARSFKAAAIRLGTSPQTVTRAVKELEAAVGELLFHRNTRQVRITQAGERLAELGSLALAQVDQLFAHNAHDAASDMQGTVRITAPSTLGRAHLLAALQQVMLDHPGLLFDLRLSEQIADVVDAEIDIGIRLGMFRDQSFVARVAGQVVFHVVATPSLVARAGKPALPADLHRLPTTGLISGSTGKAWAWYFADGEQFIPRAPAFLTDDPETELAAVQAGIAYGQLPDYLVGPSLRAGHLVSVLEQHAPPPWGVYIFRPRQGAVSKRIRLVFDALVGYFSDPGHFPQPGKADPR